MFMTCRFTCDLQVIYLWVTDLQVAGDLEGNTCTDPGQLFFTFKPAGSDPDLPADRPVQSFSLARPRSRLSCTSLHGPG